MIKVAVIGGSGYTGAELLRLLDLHPEVQVLFVSSRMHVGKSLQSVHANLFRSSLTFCLPEDVDYHAIDVVFFATPHGVAQKTMRHMLIFEHLKIIDLSADFRIRDISVWEHYYQQTHVATDVVPQVVYGLPELNREQIKQARIVACPGCYPTSVELGLMPVLVDQPLIDVTDIIANSVSGISGAGKVAEEANLFTEIDNNFKAYGINSHRHIPEMSQCLEDMAKKSVRLTFVPHIIPTSRGIYTTLYIKLLEPIDVHHCYQQYYCCENFIHVLPDGEAPQLKAVRGTNYCQISAYQTSSTQAIILVAIDNLIKGASGQAIQNMNIMFGLKEEIALTQCGLT